MGVCRLICEECEEGGEGGALPCTGESPVFWVECLWDLHVCVLSCFSCVWLCTTLWTVARQGPLSMRFSRQKYWSGFPCPPPGDLPDPGIEPASQISCVDRQILYHFTTSATREAPLRLTCAHKYRKYTSEEEIRDWWPGFHHCFLAFFPLQENFPIFPLVSMGSWNAVDIFPGSRDVWDKRRAFQRNFS